MKLFKAMEEYDYEELVFMQDEASGLKAIVCIHNSTLGPALGGTRYWEYEKEEDAIIDALRLARGMTYKNAAAGLPIGGAKAVILKDPNRPKDEAQMRAFGRFIEGLNGRYITAEDVGTTEEDMDNIFMETKYVVGTSIKPGTSGNPSPVTAHGVYMGLKATVKEKYGDDSLKDKKILVQGIGQVGFTVVEKALKEGAIVYVSDLNQEALKRAEKIGAIIYKEENIYTADVDIYCPCALGATLNDETIPQLKAKVVAGSANNQLKEERHGQMLKDRDILYAPDFIINSGGVINVVDELYGGYNPDRAMKEVENIYSQLEKVYAIAKKEDIPTNLAANKLAEDRIQQILNTKKIFLQDSKSILEL